ncbi:MAG TPA: hypothetical protein DCZ94_04195 [Lentisphaeria bacterium]|nr:MAG: hypothetical protein A2X48_05415 [Lentisphaerae bacterium GWF2_49_21]HBC86137.1 hypothetical protein [Lentisphaeria bacterium]
MKQNFCVKCKTALPMDVVLEYGSCKCPACGRKHAIEIFPAILKSPEKGVAPEKIISEGDSSCFYHQGNAASSICGTCGCYLCSLCNIEIEDKHYCPKCFKTSKDNIGTLNSRTVLYDEILLSLSVLSFLICYLGLALSPIVIIAAFFLWKKMKTPYPRNRWRFVVAVILSVLQLLLWATLICVLIFSEMSR